MSKVFDLKSDLVAFFRSKNLMRLFFFVSVETIQSSNKRVRKKSHENIFASIVEIPTTVPTVLKPLKVFDLELEQRNELLPDQRPG